MAGFMRTATLALAVIAAASSPIEARAQTPEQRWPVCVACHGATGVSKAEAVPSLGAMPRDYVLVQLILYREKLRIGAPMNALMAGLSDDDLQAYSDMVAALPAPPGDPAAPRGDTKDEEWQQARALAVKYHCLSCHGSDLAGHDQIPRIAGQREDYVLKSLISYKNNSRRAYQPAMIESIQGVPDEELPILAKFVSQFQ